MAKQIYGAIRLDKSQATYAGNIASVRLSTQTDNGRIVVLGSLESGNREVYAGATPTAVDTQEVLILTTPETSPDPTDLIVNFTNIVDPNKVARAHHMTVGDIYTITDVNIDGATTVDQYLVPKNGSNKLQASATRGTTRFVARVIEKTKIYGQPATAFIVEKA